MVRCVEVNFAWRNNLTVIYIEIFWFQRIIVYVCGCVVKYFNCAVEMLLLVLNDLSAE